MCGSNSVFVHFYILLKCVHPLASVSGWLVFLKSASLVAGLTKAFLGVGENQKELSFSDHAHNLPDLDGILTTDKGGTGVSSLDELKTALNILPNEYIMKFQVGNSWSGTTYNIRVPTNVFAGIWYDTGITIFMKILEPGQTKYMCHEVNHVNSHSYELDKISVAGNTYLIPGSCGIFWYPA